MNEELPWDSLWQVRNIYIIYIYNILPARYFSPSFSSQPGARDSGGSRRDFSPLFPIPVALLQELCMSRAMLLSGLALGSVLFSEMLVLNIIFYFFFKN